MRDILYLYGPASVLYLAVNQGVEMKLKPHKHWSEYPVHQTVYGFHKFGIGVYRIVRGKEIDYWLDLPECSITEVRKYRKWLKGLGLTDSKSKRRNK